MATRPHLSYSQLNSYASCSLRYFYQYVAGIRPQWTPAALAFGSALHEAFAAYNCSLLEGAPLTQGDLERFFEFQWSLVQDQQDISFGKDDPSTLLAQGKALLGIFREVPQPEGYTLIAIEEAFKANLGSEMPPLTGKIDAAYISHDDPESVLIIDYKTSASSYPDGKAEQDNQLTAYSLAMSQQGFPVEKQSVALSVLVKTKTPKHQLLSATRNVAQQDQFIKLTEMIYRGIQADVFYPRRDWHCSDCPYRSQCEAW